MEHNVRVTVIITTVTVNAISVGKVCLIAAHSCGPSKRGNVSLLAGDV